MTKSKKAGSMAHVAHLPGKSKALSSNSSTEKKEKEEEEKRKENK
jgi:hypothetical protein